MVGSEVEKRLPSSLFGWDESDPFLVGLGPSSDTDGRWWGHFVLHGREHKVDLTDALGIGVDLDLNDDGRDSALKSLHRVSSLRYTILSSWLQAKYRLDELRREYDKWWSRLYLQSEARQQTRKSMDVAAGTRSKTDQITKASVEAVVIVENEDEWDRWQNLLNKAGAMERSMDSLYKCLDKRGDELKTICLNWGPVSRRPSIGPNG
jgi:hypothetical protein